MTALAALLLGPVLLGLTLAAVLGGRWLLGLGAVGTLAGAGAVLLLTGVFGGVVAQITVMLDAFGSFALMLGALLILVGVELGHRTTRKAHAL